MRRPTLILILILAVMLLGAFLVKALVSQTNGSAPQPAGTNDDPKTAKSFCL